MPDKKKSTKKPAKKPAKKDTTKQVPKEKEKPWKTRKYKEIGRTRRGRTT